MKDYSTGKIYAIRSAQTDEIYIGSTIQPLCVRMAGHRQHYKQYLNENYHYTTSYKIIQYDDAFIELLENFPCSCKDELTKREGELIRENKNCINKRIEGRNKKQWAIDNKNNISVQRKQYRQDNKDKLSAIKKQYHQDNKDKILAYEEQYRQDNKDKILAYKIQYRQDNKDKLSAIKKQYHQDNKDNISLPRTIPAR